MICMQVTAALGVGEFLWILYSLSTCNVQIFRGLLTLPLVARPLPHAWSMLGRYNSGNLPVFRLDVVGEGLGLLVAVVVVVAMVVILRSDILHLVDAAAFWASLHRSLARHLPKPGKFSRESSS